jgi:hypothetical protein
MVVVELKLENFEKVDRLFLSEFSLSFQDRFPTPDEVVFV